MTVQASLFSTRPFRRRTWIRSRLPWWMINRHVATWKEGDDCEAAGDAHEWHNVDNLRSRCYHCGVMRDGQLWRMQQADREGT